MLALRVDRTSPTPLSEQLVEQIRELITSRALRSGVRLPPSRQLAGRLDVSRNTVVLAYDRLLADGWLEAGVGRGTFVAPEPPIPPRVREAGTAPGRRAFVWERSIARECSPPLLSPDVLSRAGAGREQPIRLDGAVPDPATFPADAIRKIFQEVLRREGSRCLEYGAPAGYRPLRELIATRTSWPGAPVAPEDVLIVSGSQQGLDLIARLLLSPGDGVVVEAPTYPNALQIWQFSGARVYGVPMDEKGLSPEALTPVLQRHHPKFLYLMPTFQNPTGLSMDDGRRQEIVAVAREAEVPIVEDHFDSELRYSGTPLPPLRALDPSGQVLLLGTFSKILCPGFRLGWVIAPPAVREHLLNLKRTCDLGSNLPAQMALAEFCLRGELDRHLERVRAEHSVRLETLSGAIEEHFPPSVSVSQPQGGMTVWAQLPKGSSGNDLYEAALRRGVLIAPGTWFFPEGGGHENFRLSFVSEPPGRIEAGIRILGQLLHQNLPQKPRAQVEEARPFI